MGIRCIPIRQANIYLEKAQERAYLLLDVGTGDVDAVLQNDPIQTRH